MLVYILTHTMLVEAETQFHGNCGIFIESLVLCGTEPLSNGRQASSLRCFLHKVVSCESGVGGRDCGASIGFEWERGESKTLREGDWEGGV